MPRKKSKKKLYFGPEVQDAIIRYNTNPDNNIKRIQESRMKPPKWYIRIHHTMSWYYPSYV